MGRNTHFVPLTGVDLRKVEALGYRALPPDHEGPNILVLQEEPPDLEKLVLNFVAALKSAR